MYLKVPDLTHLTQEGVIKPPAPFTGSATYLRESADSISWTGDLSVDLPGFGYASASRAERKRWTRDIEHYIENRGALEAVILLVDLRHFPMPIDADAIEWLESLGKPFLVLMTKADKVKQSELARRKADISGLMDTKPVESIRFSAKTGLGKKEVWHWMRKTLSV